MQFDILTLFPDLIYNYSSESILGRAQKQGLIDISAHNFRDFTTDKHRRVDDTPYGGGPGMVLQVQPIYDCLKNIKALKHENIKTNKNLKIKNLKLKIIALDPAGKKFDERMAEKFSKLDRLVLICGRYEGFDARVYKLVDERISVGDYVLAGGELPALTIVEATARLITGVLGNTESLKEETFTKGTRNKEQGTSDRQKNNYSLLLTPYSSKEYPQYTKPENFNGLKVPKVLLSGDHKKIGEWRVKNSK
ncbi:MAG: tRNA (guanine-N(1)-)-methyltransferase [Candidatus Magasanikbacteria bacterium GW2011_GWA2_37_8]|uniref:tRNA (guanine-N(1)-)-methyltransferase n=1 Tax=Candidatus Magasanikbacteria bacterium GW2011_GWA2_37_8 TaxID=1619036 RepID=A0A0G0HBQ4_9BACT|nr:MAG: tRNA (guanine-N(1)-)-methyltransferase [Candidatus Magasanikbacteria bacterium GW2011_GWA2_37_8]